MLMGGDMATVIDKLAPKNKKGVKDWKKQEKKKLAAIEQAFSNKQ